jgi:hypothetical protein
MERLLRRVWQTRYEGQQCTYPDTRLHDRVSFASENSYEYDGISTSRSKFRTALCAPVTSKF